MNCPSEVHIIYIYIVYKVPILCYNVKARNNIYIYKKMLILEEHFKRHLEAFASELFIYLLLRIIMYIDSIICNNVQSRS